MSAPDPRSMMHLAGRSDRQGAIQLGIHLGLIVGAGCLVTVAPGLWVVPAVVLLGCLQAALFAPFHETSHYTAFKSRRANAVAGWLVSLPSLHNWPMYQLFHRQHHLHTHDPERDPELAVPEPTTMGRYLARIAGWTYWKARWDWYRDGLRGDLSRYPYVLEAQRDRMVRALRLEFAAIVALTVGIVLVFGWRALLLYWVLPQLVGQLFLRMYLLTEHTGLPHTRDGLANTRTTLTTAALRLVMWNMPYHAEHHLYPFIPFHRLPDAHAALKDKLRAIQPGYARWQWGYVRAVARGGARVGQSAEI